MAKVKQDKKPAPGPKPKGSAPTRQWYGVIIFAFSFLLYFNSTFNNYNLDDELVTQNHRLTSKGLAAIPEIFSSPYYEDEAGYKYEYRPMVLVSFAIEHSLLGERPFTSHFINVLLYALMCLLLFKVLRQLLSAYSIVLPFFITMVFAAHPIHTEVVASIKNRDEILALIFGLLALWYAYSFAVGKKVWHLLLVPAFFYLGILSKSTTITFAFLIPLALVMLTGVSAWRLFLVTLIVAIPTVLYSRLYSITQQVALLAGLFMGVFVLYYLKNSTQILSRLRQGTQMAYGQLQTRAQAQINASHPLDFTFLKNPLIMLAVLAVIVAPAFVSASGIYMGRAVMACLPLLALAVVFIMVRKELQLVLITPISLLTVFAMVKFHASSSLMDAGLLVFLSIQMLSPERKVKAVAAGNFVIYGLVAALLVHSYFFVAALFFIGFVYRRLFSITAVLAFLSVVVVVLNIYWLLKGSAHFNIALFNLPWIYLSFFLLWRNKGYFLLRMAVLSLPVFIFLYFQVTPPALNNAITSGIERTYYKINAIKAADPTPLQAVRPIKYFEFPLEKKDAPEVKVGTAMVVLGHYLKLILLPYPMSYYYGYAYIKPTHLATPGPLIALFVYLLLAVLALALIKRAPLYAFGILFYLAAIVVFSNIFIPVPGMMGDRFLLIPSIGFSFVVVLLVLKLFKQDYRSGARMQLSQISTPAKIVFSVLLLGYSVMAFARNMDWHDRITLFRHDIKNVEQSAQAQNLLGLHLMMAATEEKTDGNRQMLLRDEATEHFKKALEVYPDLMNASFDLARTYEQMGAVYKVSKNEAKAQEYLDKAYAQYQQTLKIDSSFKAPYFNMAVIAESRGDLEGAIEAFEKYLVKYPRHKEVYASISYDYYRLGKFEQSIAVNRRLLAIMPDLYEGNKNLATTFLQTGQKDSALYYFEKSYRISPKDPKVAEQIVQLSLDLGQTDKANAYRNRLLMKR